MPCVRGLLALAVALVLLGASAARAQDGLFFDSNGLQIHFTDQGNGEPVVLIHAMLETLQVWEGAPVTRGLLDAGYRVLAFDVRPHGESGKPHDPALYGLEVVGDVVRLLDHLELDRAHIVGYSMGGMLANAVRAEHPDRVATTVLGGNGWSGGQGVGSGIDADMLARGLDAAVAGADLAEFVRSTAPPGQTLPEAQVAAITSVILSTDPAALAAFMRAMPFVRHTAESLATNTVPTLALVGERDPALRHVERLRDAMPNVEVVVIPGAHHGNARRDPVFTESLLEFLGRHRMH